MTSFYQLLTSRRSIRIYLPIEVEAQKIKQITNAALMSPASKRSNPWEFIVVQDKDMLKKLAESRPNSSQFLANSPLGIVVIADMSKSDIWIEDASIASIIMQLQAQELNLGTCWIQIFNRIKDDKISAEEYVRQLLNIPTNYAVLNIISIGYPNEEKKPHNDGQLALEKLHFEQY